MTDNDATGTEGTDGDAVRALDAPSAEPINVVPPAEPVNAAPPAEPINVVPPAEPVNAAPPAEPINVATSAMTRAANARAAPGTGKVRMSSAQRREQLIAVGRHIFAEKGLDATSVEEVAARAKVSKPVVYEHFGGKEGLYAVVVDREVLGLLERITTALTAGHPRELLEQAALALLDYIEEETDGFRVLVRESPIGSATGNFSSVLNDVAHQVEHILAREFKTRGYDGKLAELYSQALVGMVALTGRWWLEVRKPRKETVAAHLVNIAWNGLSHLETKPEILLRKAR